MWEVEKFAFILDTYVDKIQYSAMIEAINQRYIPMNSVEPWGTGIFDTEEAVIVRAIFNRSISSGFTPEEAAENTLETFFHALEAESDEDDLWFALAQLLLDHGIKASRFYDLCMAHNPENNAKRWQGELNLERHGVLATLIHRIVID